LNRLFICSGEVTEVSSTAVQFCVPIMFQKGTVGALKDNRVCCNTKSIQSFLHLSLLDNFLYD